MQNEKKIFELQSTPDQPTRFHFALVICFLFISDIMELKRMMEKLGQAKTHLELKKMIAEVDTTNSGSFKPV